jgi:hypothetical protein
MGTGTWGSARDIDVVTEGWECRGGGLFSDFLLTAPGGVGDVAGGEYARSRGNESFALPASLTWCPPRHIGVVPTSALETSIRGVPGWASSAACELQSGRE